MTSKNGPGQSVTGVVTYGTVEDRLDLLEGRVSAILCVLEQMELTVKPSSDPKSPKALKAFKILETLQEQMVETGVGPCENGS